MEKIHSVTVTIDIDTNKRAYTGMLRLAEDESISEFAERVAHAVREAMESE